MTGNIINRAEAALTGKTVLKKLGIRKSEMPALISKTGWKKNMLNCLGESRFKAADILKAVKPLMNEFAEEPAEGWLEFACKVSRAGLYPENFALDSEYEDEKKALIILMESCRAAFEAERAAYPDAAKISLRLLDSEATAGCVSEAEYIRFKEFWRSRYIFEFMRIYSEITPFNISEHISGVHYIAMHIGSQLAEKGLPVDMALMSGAAAGHDLGKFGCSERESARIPYLHYYYTDELLKRLNMPMIAHIASNHSTWDLELENLSVESLILIYADFRVKNYRTGGRERIKFYTLEEAFDVILGKLDNVDDAKRLRYEKVYAKLLDFENYLKNLGVQTDIDSRESCLSETAQKDASLLFGNEVVQRLKYTAIDHNIKLMSVFNNESAFGSLIEAARSERQWKKQRTYLNILTEYCTYMTKTEKLMTVSFLYELLSHREGDIRRQAARLIGIIIAQYDDVYRKELPEWVDLSSRSDAVSLWETYLNKIVFPDYRMTDQHKSWIGYTLKIVLAEIIRSSDRDKTSEFLRCFFDLFHRNRISEKSAFVLLDSFLMIPHELITEEIQTEVAEFACRMSKKASVPLKIAALRAAEHISVMDISQHAAEEIMSAIKNVRINYCSVAYLTDKIRNNINGGGAPAIDKFMADEEAVSNMLRDNLKVGRPWVLKIINIELLLDIALNSEDTSRKFYFAAHFSNLLKVSERVTVRHRAGESLIAVAENLPSEQINEIAVELMKGLEIGEYQFSKYIPDYLGSLVLLLPPGELDEFVAALRGLIEATNDKIGSVALDTLGEIIEQYSSYRHRGKETEAGYEQRKTTMLGMLLKGLSNYREAVSQEAFMVIGQHIFGSSRMSDEQKTDIFMRIYKKMLTLIAAEKSYDMNFFTNAAALNHIYRFISSLNTKGLEEEFKAERKIAFFPGTFDPFSLSHKGIVEAIAAAGFEVYLAIDEFSWSKKTQPRMIRRQIISMSVADRMNVFLFPDDMPVNIANPKDLKKLKEIFGENEPYMVVGSDVILNASSYRKPPEENSIHTMNHIVFRRAIGGEDSRNYEKLKANYKYISGKIQELKLPVYLEDISSTRIRENIDKGRDISNLIDSVAQNFIYENSLYLREPQDKSFLEEQKLLVEPAMQADRSILKGLHEEIRKRGADAAAVERYIEDPDVRTAVIRNKNGQIYAFAVAGILETKNLYEEFGDISIAEYIRNRAVGKMLVIKAIYCSRRADRSQLIRLLMGEILSKALEEELVYAVYHPFDRKPQQDIVSALQRQGFAEISIGGRGCGIYEVDMKEPVVVIENMNTALKEPFNKNPKMQEILKETHEEMQRALTEINPGGLVLSFNAELMNQRIVDIVTDINGVPNRQLKERVLGEYMCVPFGKIFRGVAVPNTVTKTLHTEKMFSPTLDSFIIKEYPMYAKIGNQIKTIKSFDRPIILVDDLLHKGYRIKAIDPALKRNNVDIKEVVVGVLSGRGKDLMTIQGRNAKSVYFLPNMKAWFVESTLCPFIGGDEVRSEEKTEANLINSINLILPFAAPGFLADAPRGAVYDLSVTCLKNAAKIFRGLEEEYQNMFERKLTIKRLSDVIKSPRMPNGSNRVAVDFNLAPSVYMEDYMQRLERLESALK